MADNNAVTITIGGDSAELTKALATALESVQKFGNAAEGAGKGASSAFETFKGVFSERVLEKGLELIADGFKELVSVTGELIKAGIEHEDQEQRLGVALANTGIYSKEAAEGISKFSEELSKSTRYSDDQIKSAAGLIQSLGSLSEEGLKRATTAAANLSSALGIDLESAARLLGKASEGNVEQLKRYGLQIEDTGDRVKDFDKVLSTIESRFGGSAQAMAKTFGGSITQLGHAFEELKEELGATIVTTPGLVGAIQGIKDVFNDVSKSILENKDGIRQFIEGGIDLFIEAIGFASRSVVTFFELKAGFSNFFAFITDSILAARQHFQEFGLGIATTAQSIQAFFGRVNVEIDKSIEGYKEQLQSTKRARELQAEETNAEIKSSEQKIAAIQKVTESASAAIKKRIEESRAAGATENSTFLAGQSSKQAALIAGQKAEEAQLRQHLASMYGDMKSALGRSEADQFTSDTKKLINQKKYQEALRKMKAEQVKVEKESIFAVQNYDELTQKERLANMQGTLGVISTLQRSSSGELFAIGKASAIATATIDGIQAVQKALASAPPPFGFALAALVGVATAANIGSIASQQPPTGAVNGAYVSEGVSGVDNQPFMLSKGELVAPAKSFDEVVEGVAAQRGYSQNDVDSTDLLLQQILDKIANQPMFVINGDMLSDPIWISRLAFQLREAVQFRGAKLS